MKCEAEMSSPEWHPGDTGFLGGDIQAARTTATVRALINVDALAANYAYLCAVATPRRVMCVVKANAYGHGVDVVAPALWAAGARIFGVATLEEALTLHSLLMSAAAETESALTSALDPGAASLTQNAAATDAGAAPHGARIVFWMHDRRTDLRPAVAGGLEIGISTLEGLERAELAARDTGRPALIHLKLDTGMGRNGFSPGQFDTVCELLKGAHMPAGLRIRGLMSHLANADVPGDPHTASQAQVFQAAQAQLLSSLRAGSRAQEAAALDCHLSNSPGLMSGDALPGNMVRTGLAMYGIDPLCYEDDQDTDGRDPGGQHASGPDSAGQYLAGHSSAGHDPVRADVTRLRPVMQLVSRVLAVKNVPKGHGASYGITYRAAQDTTFALIAGGYADGIPRAASGNARVVVNGWELPIVGRIAMDQCVVDCGQAPIGIGDDVVMIGDGLSGPRTLDWATWAHTIDHEIITGVGNRVDRIAVRDAQE